MELSRQTCQTFDRDRNGNSTNKCGYKQDLATAKGFGDTKIIEWFGNIRMYYTFMPVWRRLLHCEILYCKCYENSLKILDYCNWFVSRLFLLHTNGCCLMRVSNTLYAWASTSYFLCSRFPSQPDEFVFHFAFLLSFDSAPLTVFTLCISIFNS